MKKVFQMLVPGAIFLVGLALWAIGTHHAWSAERVLMAAVALAVVSVVVYL